MPIPSISQFDALLRLIDGRVLERLDALEAGSHAPQPLAQRNAKRQDGSQRLREAIADVLAAGPSRMSSKAVMRGLERAGIAPLPSDRTVRWHMKALRGNGNTAVLPT